MYAEIIGNIYHQNCGDDLKVIKKTEEKKDGKYLYFCKFLKYPYDIFVLKGQILRGVVNNPQIEQKEFIEKLWPQNCGDILRVIKKSEDKMNNSYLWECEFIKYPYKLKVPKRSIQLGLVVNPAIIQNEFIGKEFKQNCGILKVIKEVQKDNKQFFEVEFLNPYYKTLAQKGNILNGEVYNYALDEQYIGKEFLQHCGDTLKIIEKTDKKVENSYSILWKGEFLEFPCEVYSTLNQIKRGEVENPNLPWKSKELFLKFLQDNFDLNREKPTIFQITEKISICRQAVGQYIIKYGLQDYIKYDAEKSENDFKLEIERVLNQKSQKYNDNKYEIDIYFSQLKLGFEYNGAYWHSELYKDKNYHQDKSLYFQEKGIRIVHIFDYEWKNKKDIILSIFNKFKIRIEARKCKIKEISNKEYENFCNLNHFQGSAGAKIKIGLFYKNELIQIMSFGVPRFTNDFEWEIIRECSKLNYFVIGGKERLWKYFIKKYNPNSVISYCDYSKFFGNSYLRIGFKKERLNKPGFVWFDNKTKEILWRNPFHHKEMKDKKYIRIYDAGQLVFVWSK